MSIRDPRVNPLLAEVRRRRRSRCNRRLEALATRILYPLLPEVGAARQLIVSPDGALWLAPWSALPLANGRYVVEEYALRYIVSGRDLAAAKVPHKLNRPIIFADADFDLSPDAARQGLQKLVAAKQPCLNLRGSGTGLRLPS